MNGVSGTGSVAGEEWGARAARSRALAVLRVRGRALGLAVLPAAVAVVLYAGGVTGHFTGTAWDTARWIVTVLAVVVLLAAAAVALVVARARPAATPTVELAETAAPDLYRLVRDLADRLGVPAPAAIALTPDCDSWLEDRTHRAHRLRRTSGGAPVLVIGSPFLWWMRVGELRAVLAPVVAGTGPAAHPDIAAARRFVRGLDAAVAVPQVPGLDPVRRLGARGVGQVARVLLRACRGHAGEMERGVAAAGSERAQAVDYGVRIVAQEQVGLAYAGWDRLLTRVALPAWRMGRWPAKLDAGVVSALTELSRRDRLAEGFSSRLGERPACDLLEEPGAVDEATSLLAARLFHGGPAEPGPDWAPVEWSQYPEEVVDRKWRTDAARLHRVLDDLGVPATGTDLGSDDAPGPTLTRVMAHLATPRPEAAEGRESDADGVSGAGPVAGTGAEAGAHLAGEAAPGAAAATDPAPEADSGTGTDPAAPGTGLGSGTALGSSAGLGSATGPGSGTDLGSSAGLGSATGPGPKTDPDPAVDADLDLLVEDDDEPVNPAAEALAGALGALVAREDAAREARVAAAAAESARAVEQGSGPDGPLPLFPLQPPRTGRDLLADHVTAMVCCAAVDTAEAAPGLDWLDGPALLVGGERAADLGPRVLALVEDGDPEPLRVWLSRTGVRPEKPVRLV
ncbi:hypothetical protein ACFTWS_11250 [Streptomyces sp. NPDC057027]|uniref:hypothetical protein n=1 Tax=Streptomyces sp. NPDC057027 TaxID=3346004 RepID=UPI003643D453